ncbi:MAG: urease accessory protein UreF [Akkermansiaceae bacterium]|nr:urease accessory protein UreF [Akkermansiaceae bacterium]
MNDEITGWTWIGPLLHFADSALPVGAYAHSFGLEGMCQAGVVRDEPTLREFLRRDVTHGLEAVDLPLIARAHAAALDGDGDAIRRWDEWSWALRPTRQLREAAGKIGRQQWTLYANTWRPDDGVVQPGWFRHFQAPVVGGAIFAERGVPVEGALWAGCYQAFAALLQAALKLLPVGPGAAQVILREALGAMEPRLAGVLALPDEDLGTFNPLWDIAASRHERAEARMFIS